MQSTHICTESAQVRVVTSQITEVIAERLHAQQFLFVSTYKDALACGHAPPLLNVEKRAASAGSSR